MMKRMQGQQPGFMTLGKNKAKIYMEDEVGVTFNDVAGVDEAKEELEEVIEFLKEPRAIHRTSAARSQGRAAGRPARAPARPCWPRPWPARAGCRSSA